MNLLGHHFTHSLGEERRHAELPLHQVTHEHHEILAEVLEHDEIGLYILHLPAALFHAGIHLGKERGWQVVHVHEQLLAMLLLPYT